MLFDIPLLLMICTAMVILIGISIFYFRSQTGRKARLLDVAHALTLETVGTDRKNTWMIGGEIFERPCRLVYYLRKDAATYAKWIRWEKTRIPDALELIVECSTSILLSVERKKGYALRRTDGYSMVPVPASAFDTELAYSSINPEAVLRWLEEPDVTAELAWLFFTFGLDKLDAQAGELTAYTPDPLDSSMKAENIKNAMEILSRLAESLERLSARK
ncbi:MAG TPA: hypothetical protein V6D17_04000 [Candidatus Obscuribacterales bacterium]